MVRNHRPDSSKTLVYKSATVLQNGSKAVEEQLAPYKDQQDQLKEFVFDEQKILRRVPFAQFTTQKGNLGVGLLLPQEVTEKTGLVRQSWIPVVVTSAGNLHKVFGGENRALGVKFEGIPSHAEPRYSLTVVPQWLHGKYDKSVTGRQIFEEIRAAYEEYLYFTNSWYAVHAVWDIATYFFLLFPAFPYLELRGVKGAAKTKVMRLSSCFSFNASPIYTAPSEATLFRVVHDMRPTLYIDEAENLFRVEKGKIQSDARVEVINSGYEAGGTVPRQEKDEKGKFVTVAYRTYCPKMLASINGLRGATESRAIVHVMTRAPDKDARGEKEIDALDARWRAIRDKLFFFMFTDWEDIKSAYDAIGKENITGLTKRDLQLWRPLLAVAQVIGGDLKQELLKVARHQQDIGRVEEISEGSWEYLLLERAHLLIQGGQRVIYFKDLAEALPIDEKPGNKTIGRILDGLGFRDFERVRETGKNRNAGYKVTSIEDFSRILGSLNLNFYSSDSSVSSVYRGEDTIDTKTKTEESRRNPKENGGITPEESEESEESEGEGHGAGIVKTIVLFIKNAKQGFIYPEEKIAASCDISPAEARKLLAAAAVRGEVYESKPGHWGVLR